MPEAILTWNGNTAKGKPGISELLGNLPMSTCNIHSVDAQPINEKVRELYTNFFIDLKCNANAH